MSLMLALLLAQLGPSVSPGAGGALPQVPLQIPRKKKDEPAEEPQSQAEKCTWLTRNAPLDAIDMADAWLETVKGAPVADPAECKALALATLGRWADAEAAFVLGRDALPASEKRRRAELGAGAGVAAEELGANERALAHFDAARIAAEASGNVVLAGKIARDRASSRYKLERRAEAAESLAQARIALPDDAATWLISARLSRRLDRISEAQAYIEHAAALDPRDPEIGVEAGLIAVLDGRDAAARKSWRSVLAMAPDSDAGKRAREYLDELGPETASP